MESSNSDGNYSDGNYSVVVTDELEINELSALLTASDFRSAIQNVLIEGKILNSMICFYKFYNNHRMLYFIMNLSISIYPVPQHQNREVIAMWIMFCFGYISNSIFMISTVLYRKQLRDEVKVLRIICIFDFTAFNYKNLPSFMDTFFCLVLI